MYYKFKTGSKCVRGFDWRKGKGKRDNYAKISKNKKS